MEDMNVTWETVLQVLSMGVGMIVIVMAGCAGMIWLKTIQPSDARARLEDLELALGKLSSFVKRLDARERKALQRERQAGPETDEDLQPDEFEPPPIDPEQADPTRAPNQAALRQTFRQQRGRAI